MPDASGISDSELDHYRSWIGRRTTVYDSISEEAISRFSAAIDCPMPKDGLVPPMWHYGLFLNNVPTAQLGPDGHPPRGGSMPPVRLPRRMFAGSDASFVGSLRMGVPSFCHSEILSVDRRQGRAGELVLVRVGDQIGQDGTICIRETRSIVYLATGFQVPTPVKEPNRQASANEETWIPDPVALFRFSAVTFNAHRIHYDREYAKLEEGYPDIVVQGPFTAVRLADFATRSVSRQLRSFAFRGEAPLFCGAPIVLSVVEDERPLRVVALRCDGKVAMSATADF